MRALLEVKGLKKHFPVKSGFLKKEIGHYKAVDDVSFSIGQGETLGLVGESGCGKTTTGKSILRLIEPTSGEILFDGQDVRRMTKKELRRHRRNMQIIFQDPYGSLNPRMTVRDIVAEPMVKHGISKGAECDAKVKKLLETVGLSSREIEKYPHEFSGGQRQRIVIARVLSLNPSLIVCDEPVSALDVSVQAQILNLLKDLQQEFSISYLFIAHGMPVVRHISHRVGVMYLGRIVELTDRDRIFDSCLHPYTRALMSAVPVPDPDYTGKRVLISGEVPNLLDLPQGCLYCTRCPFAAEPCKTTAPLLREVATGHFLACHMEKDFLLARDMV